jgi:hypothetical protein
MINTENEKLFNSILDAVKNGTAEIETVKSVVGKDAKGKDAIIDGEWKISGYTFKYFIPDGKKYGKSTVEVDTCGLDKIIMCIAYLLRNPIKKKEKKTKKAETVTETEKA